MPERIFCTCDKQKSGKYLSNINLMPVQFFGYQVERAESVFRGTVQGAGVDKMGWTLLKIGRQV